MGLVYNHPKQLSKGGEGKWGEKRYTNVPVLTASSRVNLQSKNRIGE